MEVIKRPAERVFESRGAEPPVTLKLVESMDRTKDFHVAASVKMTKAGYSREGSGSRWWLMLVTQEFSYISFLLTLLLLSTRRKSF